MATTKFGNQNKFQCFDAIDGTNDAITLGNGASDVVTAAPTTTFRNGRGF
jgi:hypothetical protein